MRVWIASLLFYLTIFTTCELLRHTINRWLIRRLPRFITGLLLEVLITCFFCFFFQNLFMKYNFQFVKNFSFLSISKNLKHKLILKFHTFKFQLLVNFESKFAERIINYSLVHWYTASLHANVWCQFDFAHLRFIWNFYRNNSNWNCKCFFLARCYRSSMSTGILL